MFQRSMRCFNKDKGFFDFLISTAKLFIYFFLSFLSIGRYPINSKFCPLHPEQESDDRMMILEQ